MTKDSFTVRIPEKLDSEFRSEVKAQGKQYNLSVEEAIRLWLRENKNKNNTKS